MAWRGGAATNGRYNGVIEYDYGNVCVADWLELNDIWTVSVQFMIEL